MVKEAERMNMRWDSSRANSQALCRIVEGFSTTVALRMSSGMATATRVPTPDKALSTIGWAKSLSSFGEYTAAVTFPIVPSALAHFPEAHIRTGKHGSVDPQADLFALHAHLPNPTQCSLPDEIGPHIQIDQLVQAEAEGFGLSVHIGVVGEHFRFNAQAPAGKRAHSVGMG